MTEDSQNNARPISENEQNKSSTANGDALSAPAFVTIPENELERLQQGAAEYKDKYLRLLAEMDNARKRMQKERQELVQQAAENIIVEFLNPIDHMENALKFTQQMSEDVKHWAIGFQMILNQFKDVLTGHGVTVFISKGTPFDPHRHEAIEMVATQDHPPDCVVEENVRGYKMGEKVIRPARVKVSKSPEESSSEAKPQENK